MSEGGRKEGGVFFIFAGGEAAYPALVQHPVSPSGGTPARNSSETPIEQNTHFV